MLALNNLPFVSSDEDLTDLRYFYDSLETHICSFLSLNVDTSSYSQLLTFNSYGFGTSATYI